MPQRSRRIFAWCILIALAVGVCLLRLLIDRPPGGDLGLAWPEAGYARFRVTAVVMGGLIGAGLAVSGVLLQALLRNPLASPWILGLSSGAGLGVMLVMYLGHATGHALDNAAGGHTGGALAGALGTLGVVYVLGHRRRILDPLTLVLVGVVVSAMCGAGIMLLQRLVPGGLIGEMMLWMMGRVPQAPPQGAMLITAAVTIVGVGGAMWLGRAMDAATFGDDEARSVGVSLGRVRAMLFVLAGALAACAVAVAGPIAFVGLIAPHAARLLIGSRHRPLVPAAALCGVILIVGADAASQAIDFGAGRMPVGIFTALIGGPAFIWLLRTGRGSA